jgi:predicted DCC family thiol-disulfide oxidoreductase YuxK
MTEVSAEPYSYRRDPDVPAFDDSRPLFVFDGTCALCSGGASWLMRLDRAAHIAFTTTESPVGAALYRHFGADRDGTYLFLVAGRAYGLSEGYFRLCEELGGPWRLLKALRLVPRPVRDGVYRLVARNRYRWFGRRGHCALLTPEQCERLL